MVLTGSNERTPQFIILGNHSVKDTGQNQYGSQTRLQSLACKWLVNSQEVNSVVHGSPFHSTVMYVLTHIRSLHTACFNYTLMEKYNLLGASRK